MKEELKKRMIAVIGSYPNSLIESIAEQCAQVAVDFYKEREQALDTSNVAGSAKTCPCGSGRSNFHREIGCRDCC